VVPPACLEQLPQVLAQLHEAQEEGEKRREWSGRRTGVATRTTRQAACAGLMCAVLTCCGPVSIVHRVPYT
jgi:hypothetical protein